jgi:hypothetical protein
MKHVPAGTVLFFSKSVFDLFAIRTSISLKQQHRLRLEAKPYMTFLYILNWFFLRGTVIRVAYFITNAAKI